MTITHITLSDGRSFGKNCFIYKRNYSDGTWDKEEFDSPNKLIDFALEEFVGNRGVGAEIKKEEPKIEDFIDLSDLGDI